MVSPFHPNQAENYGVRILPAPPGLAWRAVSVRHFPPEENQGRHHVFFRVLDERGQRVTDVRLFIAWHWEGQQSHELSPIVHLDKPAGAKYHGDLPVWRGQVITVKVEGDGLPSDRVSGLSTDHPDELGPGGETWNSFGHHSFAVTFQRNAELIGDEPGEIVEGEQVIVLDGPATVHIVTHGHDVAVFVVREWAEG